MVINCIKIAMFKYGREIVKSHIFQTSDEIPAPSTEIVFKLAWSISAARCKHEISVSS